MASQSPASSIESESRPVRVLRFASWRNLNLGSCKCEVLSLTCKNGQKTPKTPNAWLLVPSLKAIITGCLHESLPAFVQFFWPCWCPSNPWSIPLHLKTYSFAVANTSRARYITIIVFAVIRVIGALFLRDTLDAAHNDAESLVAERCLDCKMHRTDSYMFWTYTVSILYNIHVACVCAQVFTHMSAMTRYTKQIQISKYTNQRKFRSSNFRLYWKLPLGLAASMLDSRDVFTAQVRDMRDFGR